MQHRPDSDTAGFFDRRRIAIVIAVAAATTLVAIAAGVDHRAQGSWRVPADVTATAQAAIVILFGLLAAGVLLLTVWAIFPDSAGGKGEPRHRTRSLVGTVLVLILLMTAFSLARGGDATREGAPSSETVDGTLVPTARGDRPGDAQWALGLAGVALLVGVAAVAAVRRRGGAFDLPGREPAVVATEDERVDAVRAAEECIDPRRSILLAFAAAEALLSTDPTTRRPASTSAREWAGMVRSVPLTTIVSRYELARFSDHDVPDDDRRVALDALARLR